MENFHEVQRTLPPFSFIHKLPSPKYKPMGLSKDKNVDTLILQMLTFLGHYVQIFYKQSMVNKGNITG